MVSDTNLSLQRSQHIHTQHQNSSSGERDDRGERIKNSTDSASLRKITEKRYKNGINIRATKPAPVIVSTSSSEARGQTARMEKHVMKLVNDMKSSSLRLVTEAVSELRQLAKDMDNRILIACCGAITPLVSLLSSPDQTIQEYAVTTLLNLSLNDNNKIDIAKASAIDPLIEVLGTGSPKARENSAATLFSLSVFEENIIEIVNSGAISPLVKLLNNGTPQGKRDAARALFNLSTCNENRPEIVKSGAVKSLIELMDPNAGMVDKAVVVIANLASLPEGRTAIDEANGVPVLVDAIELGSMRVKELAVTTLTLLCLNSNRCCKEVLEEGAIPPLMVFSRTGTPKAQEKANKLVRLLRNQLHVYAKRG